MTTLLLYRMRRYPWRAWLNWLTYGVEAVLFAVLIAAFFYLPTLFEREQPAQSRHPQSHAWSTPGEPG